MAYKEVSQMELENVLNTKHDVIIQYLGVPCLSKKYSQTLTSLLYSQAHLSRAHEAILVCVLLLVQHLSKRPHRLRH